MDHTLTAPVSLTEGAIKELKRLMNEPDFDNTQFLRVGVKGGGCSGMTYVLGFDQKESDDENTDVQKMLSYEELMKLSVNKFKAFAQNLNFPKQQLNGFRMKHQQMEYIKKFLDFLEYPAKSTLKISKSKKRTQKKFVKIILFL